MKRRLLQIESIPQSSWGVSLANLLPKEDWDKIRKKVLKGAGYRCEYCGAVDRTLHCHEAWEFKYSEQRLVRFDCVCELCHDSIHYFGTTQSYKNKPSYIEKVMKHIEEVNGITRKQLLAYIETRKQINRKRAKKTYKITVGKWVLAWK